MFVFFSTKIELVYNLVNEVCVFKVLFFGTFFFGLFFGELALVLDLTFFFGEFVFEVSIVLVEDEVDVCVVVLESLEVVEVVVEGGKA